MSETQLTLIANCTWCTEYVVLKMDSIVQGYFYLCSQVHSKYNSPSHTKKKCVTNDWFCINDLMIATEVKCTYIL